VRSGDLIELDVAQRRIHLCVDDDELARRRELWRAPTERYGRSYTKLFQQHVTQADLGRDFDFLEAGREVPEPDIY
jgi:dihydroxy-acid dehydratase